MARRHKSRGYYRLLLPLGEKIISTEDSGRPRMRSLLLRLARLPTPVRRIPPPQPITNAMLHLPPIKTLAGVKKLDRDCDYSILGDVYVDSRDLRLHYDKVKVFFYPRLQKFMVFVLHSFGFDDLRRHHLSHASAGDETWTEIAEHHRLTGTVDFAFHKGKQYGVFEDGKLVVIDNLTSSPKNLRCINTRLPDVSMRYDNLRRRFYLVVSADEKDLLLVRRREDDPYAKPSFWVLKLDSQTSEWVPIQRLEQETAIFLGENRSLAFSTHCSPELKENCICFTNSETCFSYRKRRHGIFHLEDGSISPYIPHDDPFVPFRRSLWFTPAL